MKINKYFLSIILFPVMSGFSIPALGYGGGSIQGGHNSGSSRSSNQQKEISRLKKELEQKTAFGERMADALARKDQEISNLKKEVKELKHYEGRFKNELDQAYTKCIKTEKELKQYKGDYLRVKAENDHRVAERDSCKKERDFAEERYADISRNCNPKGCLQASKYFKHKYDNLKEACTGPGRLVQPDSKRIAVLKFQLDELRKRCDQPTVGHMVEPQIAEYVPAQRIPEPDVHIDHQKPYTGPSGAVK